MKILGLLAIASATLALSSASTLAETQAERDERRASYFAGFSCSTVVRGQAMTIRYLEGGIGRIEFQEDDIAMKWRVKNDKFCRQVRNNEERCWDLGSESPPDEKEKVEATLRKNCL